MAADPGCNIAKKSSARLPKKLFLDSECRRHARNDRSHRRFAKNPLHPRMFIRSRPECDLGTHSIKPRLTAEVHLTYQVVPWLSLESNAGVDKLAVVCAGDVARRPKLREDIVDGEPLGRFRYPSDRPIAGPAVVFRTCDDAGPHGVQHDVAR